MVRIQLPQPKIEMSYRKKFEFNIEDIALIEKALFHLKTISEDEDKYTIRELMGKIHNQKVWYNPKDNTPLG